MQNMKLISSRIEEISNTEWESLRERMGTVTLLPFFQPEHFDFSFDLSLYEDRNAANAVLFLAFRENSENVVNPSLVYDDGSSYDFVLGVPRSWEKFEAVPSSGFFTFKYNCSADERKMQVRKDLAQKYGGWNFEDDVTKNVIWWTRLDTAPEPVLFFLYYCMKEFRDVDYAFKEIDGPGGNGQITLVEMKDAVSKWRWGKFLQKPDLVTKVFRYLDPDGGGEISHPEWDTMSQLFKELMLSMLEFLQFVDRIFGDFHVAWSEMDSDGSDSIDATEWSEAVTSMGYFGPSGTIFQYLTNETSEDKVRRGSCCARHRHTVTTATGSTRTITQSAWQKLEAVWQDRDNIRKKIMTIGY